MPASCKRVSFSPLNSPIDGLISQENNDLRNRLMDLEKKVLSQTDEITCLKSAMADCLRRLHALESKGKLFSIRNKSASLPRTLKSFSPTAQPTNNQTPLFHRPSLPSQKSAMLPTSPLANQSLTNSFSRRANQVNYTARSKSMSNMESSIIKRRVQSPLTIDTDTSKSTGATRPTSVKMGSTSGQNMYGSMESLPGSRSMSISNVSCMTTTSVRSGMSLVDEKQLQRVDVTKLNQRNNDIIKDPIFVPDEGILKVMFHGRVINLYSPSDIIDNYDVKDICTAPKETLKLDWVYGYRGRDCRSNVYYLPTGEIIYFVAMVAVLYNTEEQTQRHYQGHTAEIKCLAIHPDRITIASGQSSNYDHHPTAKSPASVKSRASNTLCGLQHLAHIRIWNSVNMSTLYILGMGAFDKAVSSLSYSSADGGDLLCAVDESKDSMLSIWDWRKEQKLTESKCSAVPILAVEFHPLDPQILITCGRGHLAFWTFHAGVLTRKHAIFEKYEKPRYMLCMTFAHNGDLITGDSSGNIFCWPRGSNSIGSAALAIHKGGVFSLLMTKRGLLVSGGGKDGRLETWEPRTLQRTYTGGAGDGQLDKDALGGVRTISQGLGEMLLIGTTRNCILQGTISMGFTLLVLGHTENIHALTCHPSLSQFITGGHDTQVALWDALSHQCVWTKVLSDPVQSAAFYPAFTQQSLITKQNHQATTSQGGIVVFGTHSGRWILLDCSSREILGVHTDGSQPINCVQFSPDGSHLAVASGDRNIYIHNVTDEGKKFSRSGKCVGHATAVIHLDWSTDGRFLRSIAVDKEQLYWTSSGKQITIPTKLRDEAWMSQRCSMSFDSVGLWSRDASPDNQGGPLGWGTREVAACSRATVRSLQVSADTEGKISMHRYPAYQPTSMCHSYRGFTSSVSNIEFLCDESRLISVGGTDTAIMQWEIA